MFDKDFYDDYPINYTDEYDMDTVSATEMTGLISAAPETNRELEEYEDIYPYSPDYDEFAILDE